MKQTIVNKRSHHLVTSTGVTLKPGENQLDAEAFEKVMQCKQAQQWGQLHWLYGLRPRPQRKESDQWSPRP